MPSSIDRLADDSRQERVLRAFLAEQGIIYDHKTDAWAQTRPGYHNEPLTWQRVHNRITLEGKESLRKAPRRTAAALQEFASKERAKRVQGLIHAIEGWPTDDTAWRTWINAVCEEGHDLTLAVMQHWIWLIRRKLLRMPVEHHICPILYGPSGGGKSIEAGRLLAPVDDIVSEQTLGQVCDERHWGELARHYVVYLDEMAGADKAQLETLKSLITIPYTNSHTFFSQRRERAPQNATLLGSSNKPVVEIIHDETSARRYWEVRCREKLDWNILNKLDHRTLWANVDPMTPSPLHGETLKAVQELQDEKLRLKPPQELWADERQILHGNVPVSMTLLWLDFRDFCSRGGYHPSSRDKLSRWMSGAKYPSHRVGKTRERCRKVDQLTHDRLTAPTHLSH